MKTRLPALPHSLRGGSSAWRVLAAILAAASLVLSTGSARAASATPPDLMAYQGFLVDANGNPLAPTNMIQAAELTTGHYVVLVQGNGQTKGLLWQVQDF